MHSAQRSEHSEPRFGVDNATRHQNAGSTSRQVASGPLEDPGGSTSGLAPNQGGRTLDASDAVTLDTPSRIVQNQRKSALL